MRAPRRAAERRNSQRFQPCLQVAPGGAIDGLHCGVTPLANRQQRSRRTRERHWRLVLVGESSDLGRAARPQSRTEGMGQADGQIARHWLISTTPPRPSAPQCHTGRFTALVSPLCSYRSLYRLCRRAVVLANRMRIDCHRYGAIGVAQALAYRRDRQALG